MAVTATAITTRTDAEGAALAALGLLRLGVVGLMSPSVSAGS
jgi:hypothetical protein